MFLACFSFGSKRRRRRGKDVHRSLTKGKGIAGEKEEDLLDEDRLVTFSSKTLRAATNNFDESLKLGQGGFGAVYKGTLANGKEVAVKKLFIEHVRGEREFRTEVNVLAKVNHRNLINLLGFCSEGDDRILVYDFLQNGSLDKVLFDPEKQKLLDWGQRYNIILGIARGLMYLHEDSMIKIIHRDIKASNILLDDKFNPQVADFGLARLLKINESHIQTRVAGTYGYMAPEYAMQGSLSSKADIHSFGVLILEIISGRKHNQFDPSMKAQSLLGWTWRLHQEQMVSLMIDEAIKSTCPMNQVLRCIHIALLCAQADPSLRPKISRVRLMLSSASVTLPNPTEPASVHLMQNSNFISKTQYTSSSHGSGCTTSTSLVTTEATGSSSPFPTM